MHATFKNTDASIAIKRRVFKCEEGAVIEEPQALESEIAKSE